MMDIKGLDKNNNLVNVEHLSMVDARNVILDEGWKQLRNEDGFELYFTHDMPIVGIIPIPTGYVAISGSSILTAIERIEDVAGVTTRTFRLVTQYFDIDGTLPVTGMFKYNFLGQLIICIMGEGIIPRVLNLDGILAGKPFSLDGAFEIVSTTGATSEEASKVTLMFPEYGLPYLKFDAGTENGRLLAGVYQIAIRYLINDVDKTNCYIISNPIPVFDCLYDANNYDGYYGAVGNYIEGRYNPGNVGYAASFNLRLALSNLDEKFKQFELIAIYKNTGAYTAYSVGIYNFDSPTKDISIVDMPTDVVTLERVTIDTMRYTEIKTSTIVKNKVLIANMRDDLDFDYEEKALDITVEYELEVIADNINYEPYIVRPDKSEIVVNMRTFYPNEVYGFYIGFVMNDGRLSRAFHIPGREAREYVAGYDENDLIDAAIDLTNELDLPNPKIFHIRDTSDIGSGLLGYWENETEVYPDTLAYQNKHIDNTPIRHHKMPSTFNMYTEYGGLVFPATEDVTKCIKLTFSNINLTQDEQDSIKGIIIYAVKREFGNRLIYGNSLLYTTDFWEVAGTRDFANLRLYDNYIDYVQPTLPLSYIRPTFTYEFNFVGLGAGTLGSTTIMSGIRHSGAYYNGILKIETPRYFPQDNASTNPDNTNRERVLHVNNVSTINTLALQGVYDLTNANPSTFVAGDLMADIRDIYMPFYNQQLQIVSYTPKELLAISGEGEGEGETVYDIADVYGDSYINVETYAIRALPGGGGDHRLVTKRVRYSFVNLSSRMQVGGDNLPGTYGCYVYNRFDSDYENLQNIIKTGIVHNPYNTYTTDFPYRVHKGLDIIGESLSESFREYLLEDYYECDNKKGYINKLLSNDKGVIIRQQYSTFIARLKDSLQTTGVETYIGASDLFRDAEGNVIHPDELTLDGMGYCGSMSYWADEIGEAGGMFIDTNKRRIFALTEGLENIGLVKVDDYIQRAFQFIDESTVTDNPFVDRGYLLEHDYKNKRTLISKKDYKTIEEGSVGRRLVGEQIQALSITSTETLYAGHIYYFTFVTGSGINSIKLTSINGLIIYHTFILSNSITMAYYIPTEDIVGFKLRTTQTSGYNWCTLTMNEECSITISYHYGRKLWICEHDYFPNCMFKSRENLFSVHNYNYWLNGVHTVHKHNNKSLKGVYHSATSDIQTHYPFASYIDLAFTKEVEVSKILEKVMWITSVRKPSGVEVYDETFNKIMVYNDTQCSDLLDVNILGDYYDKSSGRDITGKWFFNDFRDVVINPSLPIFDSKNMPTNNVDTNLKDWFEKSYFISNFVIIRLLYNNSITDNEQNTIYINDISATFRKPNR